MDTNTNTDTTIERLDVILRRVIERQGKRWADPNVEHVCTKLDDMCDVANLLGGETLDSFARCVRTLDRFEAKLFRDSAALSLCWEGAGLFGGMIFHTHAREWSIHT